MASAQRSLFSTQEVDALDDLQRLHLAPASLPDEPLMRCLERARGRGRDDYPVHPTWNSLIAGIVF